MEQPGFIYILGNEAMPGVYKIGFTTRHPKARAIELSKATACPMPFELLAYFGHDEPQWCEQEIHNLLESNRINSQREFFRATPEELEDVCRKFGDSFMDCMYACEEHTFRMFEMNARFLCNPSKANVAPTHSGLQ